MPTTADTPSAPTTAKRRSFRPRFTLAALLILVIVISPPLGYVAHRRAVNSRRKTAYEALTRKGVVLERAALQSQGRIVEAPSWWQNLILDEWSEEVTIANFPVREVSADGGVAEISDPDLQWLAHFPEMKRVIVRGPNQVTDHGLNVVARLPHLQDLVLADMPLVDGVFLNHFAPGSRLESLDLCLDNLNAKHLDSLANFASLQTLSLSSKSPLLNSSLASCVLSPTVKQVTLVFPKPLAHETICHWLRDCRLQSLQIRAMPREAATALENQADLEELIIFDSPLLDEDFQFLKQCNKLRTLSLCAMPIRCEFLRWIDAPEKIEEMCFDSTLIDDAHLVHLKRFTNLERLELNWTPISGEGFAAIASFPKPCMLRLIGCQFSIEGKKSLARCAGLGKSWDRDIDLPSNWTIEELAYFEGRHDIVHKKMPIAAAIESLKTNSKYGRFYDCNRHSEHADEFADPLDNCPKDLLAPVIRLREAALARLEEEKKLEKEYWEIQRLQQQAKEGQQ